MFRTEFPYFSREKREFRRKRDSYEPPLTAMAQVLPSPIAVFALGTMKQNASFGEQSEAPRPTWKPGQEQHPGSGFSGKEKAHKHKQICGIVPGLGGCQKFVYVFFGSFLMGEKKHISKIPTQSRDNPVKFLFTCFFSLCVFLAPKNQDSQHMPNQPRGSFPDFSSGRTLVIKMITCNLSGMIRANRFARFARIG